MSAVGKSVWCSACNETVELEGRSTLIDTTRPEVSYHYDADWKSAGSSVRYVAAVERLTVAVCPGCGREPEDPGASNQDEFERRQFGTRYRFVMVALGALLVGGNCYASCGGLASGLLGLILAVLCLLSLLKHAPGAWRFWMGGALATAALCTVVGGPAAWHTASSGSGDGARTEESATPTTSFTSNCNVRREPTADAALVGTVAVGRRYSVVDQRSGWTRIRLPNGSQGWVGCKTQ